LRRWFVHSEKQFPSAQCDVTESDQVDYEQVPLERHVFFSLTQPTLSLGS
jgi:hypothetical protein